MKRFLTGQPVEIAYLKELDVVDQSKLYCICQLPDDGDKYVECFRGDGGCNGWFHLECSEYVLTAIELANMETMTLKCPLCQNKSNKDKELQNN
jgi:hypothetical protein